MEEEVVVVVVEEEEEEEVVSLLGRWKKKPKLKALREVLYKCDCNRKDSASPLQTTERCD